MTRDIYLQSFAELVDRIMPGAAVSVTLTVHGFLVSGMLIGERQWLEELTTYIGNTPEAPDGQALAHVLRTMARTFDSLYAELAPGAERKIDFIHLRDARFFSSPASGHVLPQNYRAFWRGRLDSVDGFFLGALTDASGGESDSGFDDLRDLE